MTTAIDVLLALALVGLALETMRGDSLFRSIVMFIVFGLFMALAWARLNAPDLALAEAAIGAGVTGALLLATYRRIYEQVPVRKPPSVRAASRLALPVSALAGALVCALALGVLTIEREPGGAGLLVVEAQAEVGLGNPVTAVLLSFRGWDTLLELLVLLAAFAGARAVAVADPSPASRAASRSALVDSLVSLVVPLALLVAVYLLRAGGHAPGGAFQAGAVLAAGGVLLLLTGKLQPAPTAAAWVRAGLVLGVVVFGIAGVWTAIQGEAPLALRDIWVIYAVETAMMVSIALVLVLLFAGGAGLRRGSR